MLTINATSLRASPNDSATPPATGGDPAGFASLLRQTQVASAPHPSPAPAAPHQATTRDDAQTEPQTAATAETEPKSADDAEAATAAKDPAGRSRALVKTKGRDAADTKAAHKADATASDESKTPTATDTAKTTDTTATAPTAAIDPAVAQWLAALQRPTPKTGAAAERTTGSDTPADDAASALGGKTGAARDLKAVDAKVQADVNDKAGHGDDRFKAELAALGTDASHSEPRIAEQTQSDASAGVKDVNAAGATTPAQPQTAVRETAAPVAVALPTPVNAPDFAQALGLQLSVFAKDGVQQAELHLNPADMGPVSVQIVMDGTQARVDIGADVAATRQAIEAGLPELASALRDAGFTLAGGGVSQHSSGRGDSNGRQGSPDDSGTRPGSRRVSEEGAARVGSAARRIVTAGGLDLYA
jgi:flagellar hook-length control protein FliK